MSSGNKSREELVEVAKGLGLSFHHKLGAEKLAELIASHKAEDPKPKSAYVQHMAAWESVADKKAEVGPEQAPGAIKEDKAGEPKKVAPKKGVKVQQKGKAKKPSRYAKFGG